MYIFVKGIIIIIFFYKCVIQSVFVQAWVNNVLRCAFAIKVQLVPVLIGNVRATQHVLFAFGRYTFIHSFTQ